MTAEPERPRSSLPAPYRNPWRLLADDLRAVAADLRLRLQALSRRNREGSLPLPGFWPGSLAGLFWPLVLALLLAVLLALAVALARAPAAAPPAPATDESSANPAPAQAPQPAPETAAEKAAETAAETEAETAAEPAEGVTSEEPVVAPPSPLEQSFRGPDTGDLIEAVLADDDQAQLNLRLGPGWLALAPTERQRRALLWQEQAADLGYERLDLDDGQGRPLGHSAAVGSGMVMLQPQG